MVWDGREPSLGAGWMLPFWAYLIIAGGYVALAFHAAGIL